jgi:hypothetical protein
MRGCAIKGGKGGVLFVEFIEDFCVGFNGRIEVPTGATQQRQGNQCAYDEV